ncbi:MAG: hypothetical protein JXR80_02105 [Deltaproteobacteria bacterium]|nr:hypothetical protein [Deltaproteobacteria bacterium]
MYDPPSNAPPTTEEIPEIIPSQYAAAISLRNRGFKRDRRTHNPSLPASFLNRKKTSQSYREILSILKQTCKKLKLHENNMHISLLETPDGFLLKAYDCSSNRQVCRQLSERFFHSPEKIERLVQEIMSGTGLLIDFSV